MNIAIFGLGYVGVVSAACLARDGHQVTGVDILPEKVDLLNAGKSPIIEDDIEEIISAQTANGRLRAVLEPGPALEAADIIMVCVGTPSNPDGSLNDRHLLGVFSEIGQGLKNLHRQVTVVVRSTVSPGTTRNVIIPLLESTSMRPVGQGYEVVFHPEFMREGSSVYDYDNPPKIVVGERAPGAGEALWSIYDKRFDCPRVSCGFETAEMVKYCDNIFHALKITFANEIGQYCQAHEIDSQEVMDIFCQDTKLNISSKYLKPGFAFGGSCLPKDLRAFLAQSRMKNLNLPMLEHILPSNQRQIECALDRILETGATRIGFYGIAFKPGTDDLRESPYVELAERLLGKGKELLIYDPKVQMARLVGKNKSYVEQKLPHLTKYLVRDLHSLEKCEVILLAHPHKSDFDHLESTNHILFYNFNKHSFVTG